ncbi:hypothetical protein BDZ97DRAFT_2072381 [Flammula alnicola]|nr:hypothetical protein BDZ97DRAFT_2072381 [Flammula alnicola]
MSTARPPPTIPLMMPVSRQPVVNGAQQSTAQTVFYANPAATNAVGQTTQKSTSSSSATNAGTQKPTVSPPPIPPTPTQPHSFRIDSPFAFTKNTSSTSEVEQPAKRHASDAAVSGRPEAIISTSSHGPDMQSNSRLDNGIVQASTSTSASISTVLDRVATPGAAIIPKIHPKNFPNQTATTTKVAVIEQSSSSLMLPCPPIRPSLPTSQLQYLQQMPKRNFCVGGALDAGPSSSSSRAVDQRSSAPTIFTPVVSQPSTESADMDTSILATHSATVNKATTEPPPTPAAPALQNSSIPKVTPTTTVPETSVPSALQRSNPYAFLLIPGALESAWPAVPGKAGSSGIDTKIAGTSSQSTGVSVIDLTLSEEPTPMCHLSKPPQPGLSSHFIFEDGENETSIMRIAGFLTPSYNPSGKRNEPYVLVPPPPDYLVRYRKRIAKRGHSSGSEVALRRPKRERQRTNSVSMSVAGEEESYYSLESRRDSPADCDESFRSGSQLLKHVQAKRGHDRLKPSAEPFVPKLEPPPPIAGVLPAYLLITKLVKPAAISPERHQVLCRLVVRNIVNSDQEKPSRIRARKAARSPVDIPLEDLDSASISEMVDAGFTLWSPKADAPDDDGGANLGPHDSPMISPNRTATEIKVEVDAMESDLVPAAVASGSDRHHHEHSSDEDAVAVMLTGMSMD